MNAAYRLLPNYTYDDYIQWEGRWELIDGIAYAMSPLPVPKHQKIAGNLHAEFRAALKKAQCRCSVYQAIDYKLSDSTIFGPDVILSCKPITKKFLDFAPDLVVEVLSESTFMKDRHIKFPRYEAEGVLYYLMVDVNKEIVEIYKLVDGHYERQPMKATEPFEFSTDDCRFSVRFYDIWDYDE